jgi:hypothetical protein
MNVPFREILIFEKRLIIYNLGSIKQSGGNMFKSKILKFVASFLVVFTLTFSNTLADDNNYTPSTYVQSFIDIGYTITAVLTGNIWMITVYSPDTASIVEYIEEVI